MKRKIRGKRLKEKIGGREEQASEEGQREGGKEGEELGREGENKNQKEGGKKGECKEKRKRLWKKRSLSQHP